MASEHTESRSTGPRDYLRSFSSALGLAVGGFLVAQLAVGLLEVGLFGLGIPIRSTVGYAASTLVQGVVFVAVVVAYARLAGYSGLLELQWPSISRRTLRDVGWVVIGVVALLVVSQAISLVLTGVGLTPGTNRIVTAVRQHPVLGLYLVVLSFVATGPGEETLFRGGVQGVLRRTFSPVPAVLLSSALFGLAHVTAIVASSGATGVWGYVLSTFLLGLVLGSLYEYTDNLLVPILVHGGYDAILFAQLYLTQTNTPPGFI